MIISSNIFTVPLFLIFYFETNEKTFSKLITFEIAEAM